MIDTLGWRMIFLLNLPIAFIAGCLVWVSVPDTRDSHQTAPLDWAGAVLATAGLALLTWALTAASGSRVASGWIAVAALAGAALLAAFVWLEGRLGDRAIMPLAMFATTTFAGLTLLTFFLYGSLGGLLVLLPFLLIKIAGMSATAAGGALLPVPALIGIGSPLMGRLTARYGGRWPLAIGASVVAAGFALYGRVGAGGIDYWRDILPPTVLVGLGLAVSVAPLTTSVMASVTSDHVGAASGFNSAIARVAGLVVTAMLGFLFAKQDSTGDFVTGFSRAAFLGAASAAFAACCAVLLIRSGDAGAPGGRPS
jgi:hypothetical protein